LLSTLKYHKRSLDLTGLDQPELSNSRKIGKLA